MQGDQQLIMLLWLWVVGYQLWNMVPLSKRRIERDRRESEAVMRRKA